MIELRSKISNTRNKIYAKGVVKSGINAVYEYDCMKIPQKLTVLSNMSTSARVHSFYRKYHFQTGR